MGEVCWKKYKGKTILFEDYKNSNQNEIIELFKKANKLTLEADPSEKILVFANFKVPAVTGEVVQSFKSNEAIEAAKIIKKSAIIGEPDIVKQMVNFYTHFTKGKVQDFNKAEDALNWLIEE